MILQPGKLPWLLAHELRISWRGFAGMFGNAGMPVIAAMLVLGGTVLHLLAAAAVPFLSPAFNGTAEGSAVLATLLVCAFTWMTAQGLFSASRTLYARGDLDLLLGSPMPARHVLAVKAIGIASGSFASIAMLALPVANAGALIDGPRWLGIYPVLAAFALIATALGIAITLAIFTWAGPQRARLWTQMTGAVIAGAFVLGAQIVAALPAVMRVSLSEYLAQFVGNGVGGAACIWCIPLEAARGDAAAAATLLVAAVALFCLASIVLGHRFAGISMMASGAAAGSESVAAVRRQRSFRPGLARNMRRKEWLLLLRDPGMFAQLSLQIIYTIPVAVVLLRSETLPPAFALAPTIVVIAAQIAASLAWITVSGEDAPELIATAPVAAASVDRAKLDAVAMPVLAILAIPLAVLAIISWQAAMVTTIVAAAASTSTALLNFWHPMPSNRRGMLRRHSQSKLMALAEHVLALMWASTVVLALLGSTLTAVPAMLALGGLVCFRNRARHRIA